MFSNLFLLGRVDLLFLFVVFFFSFFLLILTHLGITIKGIYSKHETRVQIASIHIAAQTKKKTECIQQSHASIITCLKCNAHTCYCDKSKKMKIQYETDIFQLRKFQHRCQFRMRLYFFFLYSVSSRLFRSVLACARGCSSRHKPKIVIHTV